MSDIPSSLKARALAAAQPLNVHLELTYRCNWRCVFCYNPRHSDLRALSAAEWIAVLDDLRLLGTMTLTLTGGEPLVRPDFFDIAVAARARGFALRIFTNGARIDDDVADRLAALHPLAVEISLHGATAEVHDRATAIAGSFERMFAGVDRLVARGVTVQLKTPVTSLNEHQIDAMVSLAEERGLSLQLDPSLVPRDDGDRSPLAFAPSPAAIRRVMELGVAGGSVFAMDRYRGGVNCGLGRITMAIDPEGNVYPCLQWRHRAMGNVRRTPLRELWPSSPVRAEAAEISTLVNNALLDAGGALAEFPYCPAVALQETGDPLVPDAGFRLRAEIAAEVRAKAS